MATFVLNAPPEAPVGPVLNVVKLGHGSGTVTSEPAGIACGSTCSHAFANGTNVILTATPGAGSTLLGWLGVGCSREDCEVPLEEETTIYVGFSLLSELPLPRPGRGFPGEGGGGVSSVPVVTLRSSALTVGASGGLTLELRCPALVSSCSGSVSLTGRAGRRGKAPVFGKASFKISGGKVKAIALRLSPSARKTLALDHVLKATATIVAHDPAGASDTTRTPVTLRLKTRRAGAAK